MSFVNEPARRIPVIEEADVVVIGGGPGGLPAAVAAARQGAKTVLIERYGVLGGLATTGLMGPLFGYAPCEPKENEPILGGIPMELVRRLQKIEGAFDDSRIQWNAIRFDPELFKFVVDDIVREAGVVVILHAWAVGAVVTDKTIEAVIIESKSGRQAIKGKVFVDGTGDGDIANFCGCPSEKGRPGDGMTLSLGSRFRIGGLKERTPDDIRKCTEICAAGITSGELPIMFASDFTDCGSSLRDGESCPDLTRHRGDGTNVRDLTECELQIRKDTQQIVEFLRAKVPGFESCYLIDSPFQIGVRETRQILGDYLLTTDDVANVRKFPDTAVARGCWFWDMHCCMGYGYPGTFWDSICSVNCKVTKPCILKTEKYKDQRLPSSHLPPDEYYDIPYGCLVAKGLDNLLISGRCISASHEAMSSARVIGTCFAIGEAAGVASALSVQGNAIPRALEVHCIQDHLRKNGVPL